MKHVVLFVLVLSLYHSSVAQNGNATDEAAIKKLAQQWEEAWNKKDAAAMTALLSLTLIL